MSKEKSALVWSFVEKISTQLVGLIISVVLARILLPEDYGIVALLSVFFAVAQSLIDSGFGNALIQRSNRSNLDFSTVFIFNIALSIILIVILYFTAPLIATFYNDNRLIAVTRISSLVLLIQGVSIVHRTKLIINLKFKLLAKITFWSGVLSGVIGILLALKGFSYFALVGQSLSLNLLVTIFLFLLSPLKIDFKFSQRSFKELFSFGYKLMLSGFMHSFYINIYSLIIGKFFSLSSVGFFDKSNRLAKMPSMHFSVVIERVLYPILCSNQNNPITSKAVFFKYLKLACFIIFPISATFTALSEPLVKLLLTEKWLGMVNFLMILSLTYMFSPITMFGWQLINSKGRSDLTLKAEVIRKIFAIGVLLVTVQFGVIYICVGIFVSMLFDILVISHFIRIVSDFGLVAIIRNVIPYFFAAMFSGFCAYFVSTLVENELFSIVLSSGVSIIAYVLICFVLRCKEVKYVFDRIG